MIREFRIGCGQRADLLRMFLHVQVQAAFADSQLHESEKESALCGSRRTRSFPYAV